jgi:hypothetical protein
MDKVITKKVNDRYFVLESNETAIRLPGSGKVVHPNGFATKKEADAVKKAIDKSRGY